jgi:hypothetical protein
MNDDFDETSEPELTEDEEALLEEMPALTDAGLTRLRRRRAVGPGEKGGCQ